ncbi:hypothetical protein AB0N31_26325 [Streptomyces sp. NPDC051051]|uniref:hypothetical protein n=1 Tax=Streptomyces sp. NPDC051051 TaxID=3155666 RepID=UPI003442F82C
MIRLPSSHAAITAPLVAAGTAFPGVPIGRSLLDGRPFRLSPVLAPATFLPSTNSLALGGLGSGKSTTAKARIRREIMHHQHQAVIIDSFGEDDAGEWAPLVRSLGGKVIEAGSFTLNPLSSLLPPEVREQLVRSLIAAVEPAALTPQAAHALQHALNHPKSTSLCGLVDALVAPEDGRWPAALLTEWGIGMAIALSRYTEGSLRGLFDGEGATLPETDLPILSFDFSRLDRNSPAIPSLMAAVSCWAEHVWLRQSTAVHRHLVLEEAWQILLSPATSELIQRLLKNSRKAGLSLDVVMHTLSDLGDGPARDLARLCEVVHIGRLTPEEASIVGDLLDLPAWAVTEIPRLDPGRAVWKVGPHYVDIIETVLSQEETGLTDTSSRRRMAQQHALTPAIEQDDTAADEDGYQHEEYDDQEEADLTDTHDPDPGPTKEAPDGDWAWDMPPNVDTRHHDVLQAARAGRIDEAASLAALGEREDIAAHGINSPQAAAWLTTRAHVADLSGNAAQATQLRATVTHMGNDLEWPGQADDKPGTPPTSHHSSPPSPDSASAPLPAVRRRKWPYVAAIAAVAITASVWKYSEIEEQRQDRAETAAAYKGRSGAAVTIDGVKADIVAHWSSDRQKVILELRTYYNRTVKYLRIDSAGKTATSVQEDGWVPKTPEIAVPVEDPLADVTVRVAVGGKTWKDGERAASRTVRLSPTGTAYDAESGQQLPSDL